MQHELATDTPPQTPDEAQQEAREMAVLREQEQHAERVIDEAKSIRFQNHPPTCLCINCAAMILSHAMGRPVTIGPALESMPRYQRMADESHECTTDREVA